MVTMVTQHKQLMDAGGVSKLHLAVFQGKQDKVRKLLERGCQDINRGDKFGQTPLHIACHREGLLGCLKLLAVHQADLGALDANSNTALHSAAGSGAAAAAEFLLGRGLSVADRNEDGHTPMDICNMHCPAEKRNSIQILLEGGAKVEEDRAAGGEATASSNNKNSSSSGGGGSGSNAPGILASSGVRSIDGTGTAIDAGGVGGGGGAGSEGLGAGRGGGSEGGGVIVGGASSAFVVTASSPKSSLSGSGVNKPRSLSYSSSRGDSPRSKAVAAGAALAARGEQKSPLLTPRRGSATMAALAKDGAAAAGAVRAAVVGGAGEGLFTPRRNAKQASLQELHLAIFQGDAAKVEEVVERGDLSALNESDRHGQTPLHLACYKGSRVMTRLLVEGGASLDAVDVNGNGVVHAAVCDSPAVLAILIDSGADVTVANHDGLTPKRLCEQYCPPRLKERMLLLLKEATAAQARADARKEQLAEGQVSLEAVYHQLAMLRSRLAATAASRTEVSPSEAAATVQTENALLTLVEANVRVVEGQRHALQDMESTAGRLERMLRRLHMRLDAVNPGDVSFS